MKINKKCECKNQVVNSPENGFKYLNQLNLKKYQCEHKYQNQNYNAKETPAVNINSAAVL